MVATTTGGKKKKSKRRKTLRRAAAVFTVTATAIGLIATLLTLVASENIAHFVARESPVLEVHDAQDAAEFSAFILEVADRSDLATRAFHRRVKLDVTFYREGATWDIAPRTRKERSVQLDVAGCANGAGGHDRGLLAFFVVQESGARPALVSTGRGAAVLQGEFEVSAERSSPGGGPPDCFVDLIEVHG